MRPTGPGCDRRSPEYGRRALGVTDGTLGATVLSVTDGPRGRTRVGSGCDRQGPGCDRPEYDRRALGATDGPGEGHGATRGELGTKWGKDVSRRGASTVPYREWNHVWGVENEGGGPKTPTTPHTTWTFLDEPGGRTLWVLTLPSRLYMSRGEGRDTGYPPSPTICYEGKSRRPLVKTPTKVL